MTKSTQSYKKRRSFSTLVFSIMNQLRCSRRLRGLRPEIPNTKYRCFCLLEGDACLGGAIQLDCCHQFLHQSCFRRWDRTHDTWPLCRQEPARQAPRPAPLAAAAAAVAAADSNERPPRRPNLETMANEEVIARLEGLLSINVLRQCESRDQLSLEPLTLQSSERKSGVLTTTQLRLHKLCV